MNNYPNLLNAINNLSNEMNRGFQKLNETLKGEKIFSLNTLAHIIAPAFVGSICAVLISTFGLSSGLTTTPGSSHNNKLSVNRSIAYVFVATTIASAITAYIVGIPTTHEKKIKTLITSMVLSLALPSSLAFLDKLTKEVLYENIQLENKNTQLENKNIQLENKNIQLENQLVTLSLETTQMLLSNKQVSNSIKKESLKKTIYLINYNQRALDDTKIANNLSKVLNISKDKNLLNPESELFELAKKLSPSFDSEKKQRSSKIKH